MELGVTVRDEIESILIEYFKGRVIPIDKSAMPLINQFKNGDFARSLLGFMLYSNGYNLRGGSTLYPDGLFYYDGKNIFGIGLFKKTLDSTGYHLMVVAPEGDAHVAVVDSFLNSVYQHLKSLNKGELLKESFVRHLNESQHRAFLSLGYGTIDESPWDPEAASEDEEKNHKLIALADVIEVGDDGSEYSVKTLAGEESRGFRVKARMAYNRFDNFLDRNGLSFHIFDYTQEYQSVAEALVVRHFNTLKNPVGSTPEDYFNLVRYQPPEDCDQYFGKIGFISMNSEANSGDSKDLADFGAVDVGNQKMIPIMLFIGEKTDATTVALYATFSLRDESILPIHIDPVGFSAISQYSYLHLFKMLIGEGVAWVNVGGSETEDLDKFKRQLGARLVPSYWAVKYDEF